MSETKVYLFHELSSYLPLLEGEEFDDLVEDIKQHGQIEPATLFEGKILDGRNRYRACKILKRDLITREWKPSKATGSTPLQYVISENIMRRHLNEAQKAEIGMLLYDEVEKQVQEEQRKKQSKTLKERFEKGEIKRVGGQRDGFEVIGEKKIITTKKDDWTSTAEQVAKKVRVKPTTIRKVKKIRETAYEKSTGEIKDKEIAEKWEDAKRGESSVDAVYKKVKLKETIEKLPEDLKKEVKKEKPIITVKEAKEIAVIPTPQLRKEAIKVVEKQKGEQEDTMKYMQDVTTGKVKSPQKIIDLEMKIINEFAQIYRQVKMKMTKNIVKAYNEQTQIRLLKIMKEVLIYLQKELDITGNIIDV